VHAPPYKVPPIEEALVEFHFEGQADWESRELPLLEAFASRFAGERRELKTHEVKATWADSGSLAAEASARFSRHLLAAVDGKQLVGVGDAVLSVHVLAPYPGWARFRPLIDEAFETYGRLAEPRFVTKASVRYIDQILVPEGADLEMYFTALPRTLPSQPKAVSAFQVTTDTIDHERRVRALLTLLSGPSTNDRKRVIVYDLNLTHDFEARTPASEWGEVVEMLHARQKEIFEESILDPTRELFR